MDRVISAIAVKRGRDEVRVLGYSRSDRGQKFVNGVVHIDTKGLPKPVVDQKIAEAIEEMLKDQVADVPGSVNIAGIGG